MSPAEIIARAICNGRKPMVVDGDAYDNLCSWAVAGDMDAVDELAGFDREAERALAALEAEGFVVVPAGDGWSTDMSGAPKMTPVVVELPEHEVRQRDWQHGQYQIAADRGMGWISIPGMWRCHPVAWCPIPARPR